MKITSKKLLLWLHSASPQERRRVPISHLDLILSELTPEGRQSLVRYLESDRLLFTDELDGTPKLSLSSHGLTQLEADFPALRRLSHPWEGDWLLIIFTQSPTTDQNFRYLRSVLLQEHCLSLKRGVYLHAGEISQRLENILHSNYRSSVVIVKTASWEFGDPQIVIGQNEVLKDIIEVYSGIGKEIETLLTNFSSIKRLSDRQKRDVGSIYDRIVQIFQQDSGIIPYFYENVQTGIELLERLKLEVNNKLEPSQER